MDSVKEEIGLGLLGLGVVGRGVAQQLLYPKSYLGQSCLKLRKILVKDPHKTRPITLPDNVLTTKFNELLNEPDIHVLVEALGGEHPAYEYIQRALQAGKHVVTANKEVIAKHGLDLLNLAEREGVQLRFEASVGGGIPIIGPLRRDLIANDIFSIRAIINGTTNYILTRMSNEQLDLATALADAQAFGYAEPDPTNDLEGTDAAYKLSILALLAFRTHVKVSDVYCQGITHLEARDFRYARELGYEIKLLAIGKRERESVQVRVHPCLIPMDAPLAKVGGAFNAIEVWGDLVGPVVFSGLGAGSLPTTSAILSDVLELAQNIRCGSLSGDAIAKPYSYWQPSWRTEKFAIRPMEGLISQYYLRLNVADRPGVLAQMTKVLGNHQISLASIIQKDADLQAETAEIVITTHPAQEGAMQKATKELQELQGVTKFNNLIRIEAG
jgi:homoserine dehydrogenase